MKYLILLLLSLSYLAHAEELVVSVKEIPGNAVLIGMSRNLIPSVHYKIANGKIIFNGNKDDLESLKDVVGNKSLLPYFMNAYQKPRFVSFPVTFQVSDMELLINTGVEMNCRMPRLRSSSCNDLTYYSRTQCELNYENLGKLLRSVKVTSSLEFAHSLKVYTDNPCLNPKTESLYDFALKQLSAKMANGDFDGNIESTYEAYVIEEQPLEIL